MERKRCYEQEVVSRLERLCSCRDVSGAGSVTILGKEYPLFCVDVKSSRAGTPWVLVSGGVHGDEPAGVYAALDFLEKEVDAYRRSFNFRVLPCVSPAAFEYDTWENPLGQNPNRDFSDDPQSQEVKRVIKSLSSGPRRYGFTWDMHESGPDEELGSGDFECPLGFYMWEICEDTSRRIGDKIVLAVEGGGHPVCKADTIWGDKNTGGVIYYPEGCSSPEYDGAATFDQFLHKNYTRQAFTIETPTIWTLRERVQAQKLALRTALENWKP